MACSMIRTWTLSKLVGAFLDLSIAYVMLCGSTIAYFASKFLGFFGLNLPCPCNGLFGNPNEAYCVQRVLVEYPADRISSVHSSVKSKFPFDLICGVEHDCQGKMNRCISFDDRPLELEGEGSCSSVSNAPKDSTGWELVPKVAASSNVAARFDLKRKGIAYQRPKSGLRRRRKVASDNDMMSSAASYDACGFDLQGTPKSSFTFNKEIIGENIVHDDFKITENVEGNDKNLVENDWHDEIRYTVGLDLDRSFIKYRIDIEDGSILDEFRDIDKEEKKLTGEEAYDVKALEQALKEEQTARTALYLELEKERNAAATAADEAMGMILRLQEEKASIEMQARQYQRMIEEKSAYDAEEMNLLTEILLRRERETYILEKKVENYKQIILGGDKGVPPEMQEEFGLKENSLIDCDEDPLKMLHEISESIRKKESDSKTRELSNSEDLPVDFRNETSSDVGANTLHDCETVQDKLVSVNESVNELFESQCNDQHIEKQKNSEDVRDAEADSSIRDKDTPVVDVHVVGHESSSTELILDKSSIVASSQHDMSEEDFVLQSNENSNDHSSTSRSNSQFESMRRHSDIPSRSPPVVSKVKLLFKEESSSSAVDFERLKIEREVELLREKLKIVQEGREKLNFSVEHSEGEKVQLQLLEDIANQLREIRLLRAPERSVRQASVPLHSSKVETKKRRCRSVSSGIDNSS
ncbi:unnamed protein product [Rhodiola kirilowii]